LFLAAFAIMWAAFLIPAGRRRSEAHTVDDFERRMELLATAGVHGTTGRWIVTPRKGVRFLGPADRHRARVRQRRKRVLVFLIEALFLSLLIGLVPPLRVIWWGSLGIGVLLFAYIYMLLAMKARASHRGQIDAPAARRPTLPAAPRFVANGLGSSPRRTFNGLGSLGESDDVHVVVKAAGA
jgi:hypothetical protein